MCENVFSKGSETIFSNKAFRMLTGLRHYKLLDTEMGDDSMSARVSSNLSYARCPICGKRSRRRVEQQDKGHQEGDVWTCQKGPPGEKAYCLRANLGATKVTKNRKRTQFCGHPTAQIHHALPGWSSAQMPLSILGKLFLSI